MRRKGTFHRMEDDQDMEIQKKKSLSPKSPFRTKRGPRKASLEQPKQQSARKVTQSTKKQPKKSKKSSSSRGILQMDDDSVKLPKRSNLRKPKKHYLYQAETKDPVMELFKSRQTQKVRFIEESQPIHTDAGSAQSGPPPPPPPPPLLSTSESSEESLKNNFNIKSFMMGVLFSSKSEDSSLQQQVEQQEQLEQEAIEETQRVDSSERFTSVSDTLLPDMEDTQDTRAAVTKLLNKARRAQFLHYKYSYAVKCYVKAHELLSSYPPDHPLVTQTLQNLQAAHHANSAYEHSANIVKIGIKHEDNGDYVRALKMYTIAYRMRRDNLTSSHPSLVVLLNMLGSIQIKRGELDEAMQIYELALRDAASCSANNSDSEQSLPPPPSSFLTRAVSYREMGVIREKLGGQEAEALRMYHKSLDCFAEYKGIGWYEDNDVDEDENQHLLNGFKSDVTDNDDEGGLEMTYSRRKTHSQYDVFFPIKKKSRKQEEERSNDPTDVDVALTIHQIAQLHRSMGEHQAALQAFNVSLRGMKSALGKSHPNVAAILGNIGNLQKEMGDMDAAYSTYQQVLAIESYRLGLSHPDVVVTLHNIATIDAARGNNDHALSLYTQVLSLQRKLFGEDHESVAVTSACMGDVYEKSTEYQKAVECYEEALRIKIAALGRHSLEVARLLHKLGKLVILQEDFHVAQSYIQKAALVYKLNKLGEEDDFVSEVRRDSADVDAAIAMGRGVDFFEC